MRILVNGENRQVAEGVSLADALKELGIGELRGVGVELDGEFIEREAYGSTPISEGAELAIVRFVGGG